MTTHSTHTGTRATEQAVRIFGQIPPSRREDALANLQSKDPAEFARYFSAVTGSNQFVALVRERLTNLLQGVCAAAATAA